MPKHKNILISLICILLLVFELYSFFYDSKSTAIQLALLALASVYIAILVALPGGVVLTVLHILKTGNRNLVQKNIIRTILVIPVVITGTGLFILFYMKIFAYAHLDIWGSYDILFFLLALFVFLTAKILSPRISLLKNLRTTLYFISCGLLFIALADTASCIYGDREFLTFDMAWIWPVMRPVTVFILSSFFITNLTGYDLLTGAGKIPEKLCNIAIYFTVCIVFYAYFVIFFTDPDFFDPFVAFQIVYQKYVSAVVSLSGLLVCFYLVKWKLNLSKKRILFGLLFVFLNLMLARWCSEYQPVNRTFPYKLGLSFRTFVSAPFLKPIVAEFSDIPKENTYADINEYSDALFFEEGRIKVLPFISLNHDLDDVYVIRRGDMVNINYMGWFGGYRGISCDNTPGIIFESHNYTKLFFTRDWYYWNE